MSSNFQLQNGQIVALTPEAKKLLNCPTERIEFVDQEITWDVAPYNPQLQTYDLSDYGLTSLEEEYICFLHGL